MTVPIQYYILLSGAMFAIGLFGVMTRQNALQLVIAIEILLNAANINFVAFAFYHGTVDGQLVALAVIALAAAEVAVGIGILIAVYRVFGTIDIRSQRLLSG